ncbi:MAG: AlkZ-related protein [Nocardioidaceae bacterium]
MPATTREPNGQVELGRARERRWWVRGRRVRSLERAGRFVDDVGFALLFPSERVLVPSLWEAVAGGDAEPFATGMDLDEQRVWSWKDELPRRGLAWYGNLVAGRGSFLSPSMLRWLYPGCGGTNDHTGLDLSPTAHEIATALADGPAPSATLRALIGDRGRYQRAAVELQHQLLVTTAGVQEQASGWPSAVLDLTCRRFDVGAGQDHLAAAEMFIGVVLDASARDLAHTFRWPLGKARGHLDVLASSARAVQSGNRYLAPSIAGHLR